MNRVEFSYSRQRGVTLIEMMIAFALSAILIMGVVKIFDSNKMASSLQSGMARIQESGRVSTELMSRIIRNAAFMGCAGGGLGDDFNSIVDKTKYSDTGVQQMLDMMGANAVSGYDNVTAISSSVNPDLNAFGLSVGTSVGQLVSGTDVLVLNHVSSCDGGKVVDGGTGSAQLKIADATSCGIEQGDIVVVSNCKQAEAFGVTSNPASGGGGAPKDTLAHGANYNINPPHLEGNYEDDSFVYKPTSSIFYIGNGTGGEPALFMRGLEDITPASSSSTWGNYELAQGVENMQILYGEDTDGDMTVNRYVAAGSVTDMQQVIAIRTRYLVRSPSGATTMSQTYQYNGAATTTSDTRIRVSYETTSLIRNRVR